MVPGVGIEPLWRRVMRRGILRRVWHLAVGVKMLNYALLFEMLCNDWAVEPGGVISEKFRDLPFSQIPPATQDHFIACVSRWLNCRAAVKSSG